MYILSVEIVVKFGPYICGSFQVKSLTLFVTHYPLLAQLERLYPGTAGNFHMSYVEAETTGFPLPPLAKQWMDAVFALIGEGYEKIVFLYQLEQGQAGKSYGLNVAALAGIDPAILKLASEKSRELEAECRRRSKLGSNLLKKKAAASSIISLLGQQELSFDPGTAIHIATHALLSS